MLSVIHVQIRHRPKRRLQRSCFWSRFSSSAKRRLIGGNRLQGVPPLHSEWTSTASPSPQRRIRFMEVPFSNANRIRLIEVPTLSRWPSSPSGWDSPQGVPPLSTANGIRFKGVPFSFSKRMGFASRGSPSPKRMEFASNDGPSCSKSPFQGILLRQGHANQGIPSLQRALPLHLS